MDKCHRIKIRRQEQTVQTVHIVCELITAKTPTEREGQNLRDRTDNNYNCTDCTYHRELIQH